MSDAVDIILLQLRDGLYPATELDVFQPETKTAILQLLDNRWGPDSQ
jgi:hypothetical protein